jgi:ACS family hexuronate transporter-like MFS transporter
MKKSLRLPPLVRQVRWYILTLLFLITVINFVERQGLSVVAPLLRNQFHLSATDYGIVVASFQFGMMLAEFPMGMLMDRRGVRFGLSFAVLWWSLANAFHALSRQMLQLCAFRFWLGTGQCANISGGVKVVSRWFPARERALAIGIYNGGCLVGPMVAPPLLVWIALRFGWRAVFLVPSVFGAVLALVWAGFYRDPERHTWLTPGEKRYIEDGAPMESLAPLSTRSLLSMRGTWGVILARALVGPVFQFYLYWLPEYLYRERGLSLKSIGLLAWMPFLFGDIGSVGGGWLAGFLIKRGFSIRAARQITIGLGAACCLLSLAVAGVHTWQAAIALICVVLAGQSCFSANLYAVIPDVVPSSSTGRVTALTGISAGLTGMLFPLLTGWIVDRSSYMPVFLLAAAMPLAGWAALLLTGTTEESRRTAPSSSATGA